MTLRGRPGPGHRRRRLHRQPPRRAAGRARAPTSAPSALQLARLVRAGSTSVARTSATRRRRPARRHPRRAVRRARRCEGVEVVFHLGGADRHPVLLRRARVLRRHQRQRHAQRARGGPARRRPRLVHTSTSEVYGTPAAVPISERTRCSAQSPYAATKIGADQLALAFYRAFEPPVAVLRPFNTYGPRQSARAVIPTMLAPAAGRRAGDPARAAGPAARLHLRRRHRRRLRPGRGRPPTSTAGRSSSAPGGPRATRTPTDALGPPGAELVSGRRCRRPRGPDEAVDHVGDEREVASRVQPPEPDLPLPGQRWRSIVGTTARSDWRGP